MSETMTLEMAEFLRAFDTHGQDGCDVLIARGHPPKVVYAKAEKAARKGYYEYGVSVRYGWLTPEGRRYLAEHSDGCQHHVRANTNGFPCEDCGDRIDGQADA